MTRRTVGRRRFVKVQSLSRRPWWPPRSCAAPMPPASWRSACGTIGCRAPTQPPRPSPRPGPRRRRSTCELDFITSQGNKLILTAAAEAQARSGHDILSLGSWDCARYSDQLVPVDDVMAPLIKQNGAASAITTYLGVIDGKWLGVPATPGAQFKGPTSRIDLLKQHAGIDVQAMYPAGAPAQGRRLDARRLPEGGGGLPQGGLPVRHRARHDGRFSRYLRRHFPQLRCGSS